MLDLFVALHYHHTALMLVLTSSSIVEISLVAQRIGFIGLDPEVDKSVLMI